jgi:hypothetical protein
MYAKYWFECKIQAQNLGSGNPIERLKGLYRRSCFSALSKIIGHSRLASPFVTSALDVIEQAIATGYL